MRPEAPTRALTRALAATLLAALLGSCAATSPGAPPPTAAGSVAEPPPQSRMDSTMGTYGQGRESRLILVLMDEEMHAGLVGPSPGTSIEDGAEGGLPEAYAAYLEGLRARHGVRRVADWPLASLGVRCLVMEVDRAEDRDRAVTALAGEQGVTSAQAMQLFDVRQSGSLPDGADTPVRPSAGRDSAGTPDRVPYDDPLRRLQLGLTMTQAERSHRWTEGEGVLVAVIDTGVDLRHPDLVDRLRAPRNFVDDDERTFSADIHGTAVAGIIAASADNRTGMVGMAPRASVLPLKACWQHADGAGEGASCNSFTLAKALNVAIGQEADIINLSLTGPPDPLLERLVATALARGAIVVGARGDGTARAFPADVAGTLAVNVVRAGDAPPPVPDPVGERAAPSVTAPGEHILSTRPTSEYGFFSGSSFASAHVAGLAALARGLVPDIDAATLATLLALTDDPSSGAINACRAIAHLRGASFAECA